jgi:hypothetical protein
MLEPCVDLAYRPIEKNDEKPRKQAACKALSHYWQQFVECGYNGELN